jgi:D-alanyl-lipoteichoic acid acyltransferase DltB (MBOAT superfamily)
MSAPTFSLILPVGISFYTFQALGYTIDVYRGEVTAERNFFKYALFVSFFPQLVAGPIERSKNLLNQVRMMESVQFNYERMRSGLLLMIWGLFLKVVLAERAAIIVNQVYNNYENYTGFYVIIATFLFAIQIYVDFSAYSLIAIGAAEVLGFNLMQNFNTPYFSRTVGEFWRRWHISLSTWFRDYLYIPLGGNRCSRWRKHLNILIVFVVSGLWHGANWTFVIWGGLNGIYQIIGAELKPIKTRIVDTFKINTESFSHKFFQIVVVFSLINLSWIFFRAPSTSVAINMITHIFAEFNIWIFVDGSIYKLGLTALELKILVLSLTALLIASLCQYNGISIRAKLAEQAIWFRWAAYITAIMILLIFGYYGPTYSPSDFIYFQF